MNNLIKEIQARHENGVQISVTCLNCGTDFNIGPNSSHCERCKSGVGVQVYECDAIELILALHKDRGDLLAVIKTTIKSRNLCHRIAGCDQFNCKLDGEECPEALLNGGSK